MKINDTEFRLLVEISKLIKKYGPDSFEKLATFISKPEFNQILAEILNKTAKAARTASRESNRIRKVEKKSKFRDSLVKLKETESEKADILISLYDNLQSKTYLPTLKELKNFTLDNGMSELKATSRDKALIPFVKLFLELPLDKLKKTLENLKLASGNKGDRSLEGWSNIIFEKSSQRTNKS